MKLTTHLHLVLRFRVHGAVPPLFKNNFMEWCLLSTGHVFMTWYIAKFTFTFNFTLTLKEIFGGGEEKGLFYKFP
jgi:hypothetical protein